MLRSLAIPMLLLLLQGAANARAMPTTPVRALPDTGRPALIAFQTEAREREPGPADLEEAIEIALERYGGEAADAKTVVREGREVHEIRVLGADGSVRLVRVDPETGRIIPQERERG